MNITQLKEKVSKGCGKHFTCRWGELCSDCQAQLSILDEVEKIGKKFIIELKNVIKNGYGLQASFEFNAIIDQLNRQSLIGEKT